MPKKNFNGYTLRDDNDRIVYIGITDDPLAQHCEHIREGKEAANMVVEIGPMTLESAQCWNAQRLESYRESTGRIPKYNIDLQWPDSLR